jgi:hypothetical protein
LFSAHSPVVEFLWRFFSDQSKSKLSKKQIRNHSQKYNKKKTRKGAEEKKYNKTSPNFLGYFDWAASGSQEITKVSFFLLLV